jgi:MFS transporter, ACS family, glucarate transporter
MSAAVHPIQTEFGLTNLQVGSILSAFIIGYAALQFPVGVLVDRAGPHRVLAFSIFGWSAFTLVTPIASWLWPAHLAAGVITARLLAGAAQAGVLTSAIKAVSRWLPPHQRATGNGVAMMGLGIGGAISPSVVVALVKWGGWRAPFFILGAIGIAIGCIWVMTGREPAPAAVASRRRSSAAWRTLIRSTDAWALALSYGVAGYTSYVIFTWFFLYLVNVRHMSTAAGGFWAGLPYVAVMIGTLAGGRMCDLLSRKLGKRLGRLGVVLVGETIAALLIPVGGRVEDAHLAVFLITVATGCHLFGQTASWAAAVDLAPADAGTLFGVMNTFAQITGAIAPVATPAIASRLGWVAALDFAAAMVLLAALLWCLVDPASPVTDTCELSATTAA